MNRLLEKVIAVLLVITLAGANLSILGMYGVTYALTDTELAGQSTTTENSNVEFNAYFEGGGHVKTEEIGSTTAKMYVNVKVKNAGYLKNGQISFQNVNFKINGDINNSNVQSVDKENNKIVLQQLNNGSDVTIEVPIAILDSNTVSIDNFVKETKTVFQGTYIDANGKEKSVSKEIVNKLSWHGDATINWEARTFQYSTYEDHGRIVVQYRISTGLDNKLPIKSTNIELQLPDVLGIKARYVTVVATNTKATNGETDGFNFDKGNYTYDGTKGIVNISVSNLSDKIMWEKDSQDEYIVTCVYQSNTIADFLVKGHTVQENIDVTANAKVQIEAYNNVETIKTENKEISTQISNIVLGKDLIALKVVGPETLGKGQIYANYGSTLKKETNYWTRYDLTIYDAYDGLRGTLEFTQDIDNFVTANSTEGATTVLGTNYTYNKAVKINQKIFNKILGEEGTIDVCNKSKVKIGTINKTTTVDSDGNYVLDISSANNNQLVIVTSAPILEGNLVIDIEKAIKTNTDYTQDQMKSYARLRASATCKSTYMASVTDGTDNVEETFERYNTSLTEVTSVAEVSISKTDLSTVVKNENVEIRATLDTSTINNSLYKNPTLKIKLPSYINKVDLKSSNILMSNGLKIKSAAVATENGAQVINVVLEGTQAEYTIDAEYKGTIIVLNTDLTTNTLTPSNSNKITMDFTNANTTSTNTSGTVETKVNFVAPGGVVASNGISNFAEGKGEILSISDEGVTGTIATYADARTATVSGTVINNYSNKISNVVVLGRIPVKDNKKIDGTDSLGSTFSTTLKTNLTVTGIDSANYTVYYSENVDATSDVNNSSNGWSTTATTGAKSFMIVTKNYEMVAGSTMKFTYDVEIPANLAHNNNVYEMYKVYYNNVSSIGTMAESKASSIACLTTGEGAELSATITAVLPEGTTTVREGQIVKMKVTVKNTGSLTANNVKVKIPVPEGVEYVKCGSDGEESANAENIINIGTIASQKSVEISYDIKISNSVSSNQIVNKVIITADEVSGEIPSSEYKIATIQEGKLAISIESVTDENTILNTNTELKHTITLYGYANLTNTVVTVPLPNGIEYKNILIKNADGEEEKTEGKILYDKDTNIVKVQLGELLDTKVIELYTTVGDVSGTISFYAKAVADGIDTHYSNMLTYVAEKTELEISELTSTPKYVKESEIVTYTVKVKNIGQAIVRNVVIQDILPTSMALEKAIYMYAGEEQSINKATNNNVKITINQIAVGETIEIKILAKTKLLEDKNEKQVQNTLTISAKGLAEIKTNTVTNVIEYNENVHQDIPTNPEEPITSKYKITGTAWIDANKNGKIDSDESILPNMSILLLNKNDNSIVRDSDSNEQKKTTTGNDGKYEFSNLVQGEYIVIFLYDASKYSLTTYKEKDVDESINSDAININITIDGNRTIAGTSDAIKISDNNVRDINIGVYSSEKFDLRLDKYISKITLTTPTIGTKTYDYDNSKVAKIEVLGSNLGKSNIVIEYKIVVKNEGAIAGYAKKIVDYLPTGIGFNTELNQEWYLSENGNVYNASLANDIINPGESKELTLVVTKKITEDGLGTLNNSAEIYESYNEQGLSDMDSTPGNKVNEEDDLSQADIVLGIVTGKIITYTAVTFGIFTILGFGIFEIKKRVLKKKNI